MAPARRWWRFALAALLGAAAASALGIAWLLRDPVPRFDARRGALASAREGASGPRGAAVVHEVEIAGSSGLTVRLLLQRPADPPDGASAVRRPLFLILGGFVRGRAAAALLPDTLAVVVAALDYPFEGDRRATGLAALAQAPAIRRTLYDTPPAVSLALDYLLARPDVDPARVELVGASFGAPFATIAAARDPRVTRLWLAHAGGDTFAMIDEGLKREIAFAPARRASAALLNLLASGPRFAPERWIAQVAPRPVVMLNAADDERIPRHSVEVLWAAAREPKELVWLPGAHMQGNRPDVLAAVVAAVLERAASAPGRR